MVGLAFWDFNHKYVDQKVAQNDLRLTKIHLIYSLVLYYVIGQILLVSLQASISVQIP